MSRPKASEAGRKPKKPVHFPPSAPHQVRIIGGMWKRTPLAVLAANGLRPTPDRVRETVFNWLGYFFNARWDNISCLDLFAGTGAFGFEAASRGAASVTLVESSPPAVRQMEAVKDKLKAQQLTIVAGDAMSAAQRLAQRGGGGFNVIFLDPPYHHDWLPKMLPACVALLAAQGMVYVEAESALDGSAPPDWLEGWEVVRADKAGAVYFHLLKRRS
ncbi:MAG: 16S rRNA (guanine(966)-N(2))-methyltransferase RsmD [Janthinobacterium lividum]